MPRRADGYQQTSGYVIDATLYDSNTATGYDRTVVGVAQLSEISGLLDYGLSPATPLKKILCNIRFNSNPTTGLVEYASSLAGPWTVPAGSWASWPASAGTCTPGQFSLTWTNTVAVTARYWRLSLRNTDVDSCGTSIMGLREIEGQDGTSVHIAEVLGPSSFTVTPSNQNAYVGVATGNYTITLDSPAVGAGEILNFGDAGAGGTFAPLGTITIAAAASTGTFTYLHPNPGTYTLTVTDVTSSMGAHSVTATIGGFATYSGGPPSGVGAGGLRGLTDGLPISAASANNDATDLQSLQMYSHLAGVLFGGVCTAALLQVTVPASTVYYARQVWTMTSSASIGVPDASTTAIWACSDGQLRTTGAAATRPIGFDSRNCCLLTVATSAAGVATLNNALQERGRYSDRVNARTMDNGGLWAAIPDNIPAGVECVVPSGHQVQLWDTCTVAGTLTVFGRMRVAA